MIPADVFRHQPTLTGDRVRLEPLTPSVLDDYLAALADPEVRRLTGTHAAFDRAGLEGWLATRVDQHDRADWAAVRVADGAFLGEAVLNELDVANASVSFRLLLGGAHLFGRGYGTEVTRLVLGYAFDHVGLHRVSLGVYELNLRARRMYERCGFVHEGRRREALHWEGQWYDELMMAVLRTDLRPGPATSKPAR